MPLRRFALSKSSTRVGTSVVLSIALALLFVVLITANANASSMQTHVVAPGERLASIARQYCTTWQELYDLNRYVLGENPDYLPAGTTLTVIDHCVSGGEPGGVYGRVPTTHARGTVSGNTYYVQRGDTIFSIANRFGVDQYELMRVNGIHNPTTLQAGSTLTIPGLGPGPTLVPPVPTSYVMISSPTQGAFLPSTFTVSGRGGGLYEGNVVVQARGANGVVLAEAATTLQSNSTGTGGKGSYNVQLTVNATAYMPGLIVAFSPSTPNAYASVNVTYNGSTTNAYVTITEPASGASLPTTFTTRGAGRGLFEGNVVVQAQDMSGRVLAQTATVLQGANVGTGGEGTWSAQLSVSQAVEGKIVASSPGSVVPTGITVRFNGGGPGPGPSAPVKYFYPGECSVHPRAGAPAYGYPEGPQVGTFAGGQAYGVMRGVYVNGVYWYYLDIAPGSGNPFVWVKEGDLENRQGACTW